MTKSTITRDELNEVIATYGKHHIAHRMANLLLAAMDSEPDCKERKLFCSTDTARMRKVISVSAGTGDAPLYRHAQPAPVVPGGYVMVAASLLSELRDWAHPKIEDYCEMWAGRRDDEFPALRKVIADTDALLAAAPQSPGSDLATVPGKWIPVSEQKPDCWCLTCRPVVLNDMRFVVCPDCGNKRCPRANDHRNACTGSNEPGQEGSAYPDTPREVK